VTGAAAPRGWRIDAMTRRRANHHDITNEKMYEQYFRAGRD
jgi:hypothetical protein